MFLFYFGVVYFTCIVESMILRLLH